MFFIWDMCIPAEGDKPTLLIQEARVLTGIDTQGRRVNEASYKPLIVQKGKLQGWTPASMVEIAERVNPLGKYDNQDPTAQFCADTNGN
jgi:hypothetical protein